MILKFQTLPVRLSSCSLCDKVRRQPAHAPRGVSECGLHPPPFPPSLPPSCSALITPVCLCCSTIAVPSLRGVGCSMTWITSTCFRLRVRTQPSYCTLHTLYEALSSSHPLTHTHCTHADPLWWLWQPFFRSKRFLSKQNQSPPPSSAAESSGVRSLPASLFKLGLKRWADLHSTFTFRKTAEEKLGELRRVHSWIRCLNWKAGNGGFRDIYKMLQGQVILVPAVYSTCKHWRQCSCRHLVRHSKNLCASPQPHECLDLYYAHKHTQTLCLSLSLTRSCHMEQGGEERTNKWLRSVSAGVRPKLFLPLHLSQGQTELPSVHL